MSDPDRFIDLYHRTDPESARSILSSRQFISKENTSRAFFSTDRESEYGKGFGDAVVHVRVPRVFAELDDEFPSGEQHYAVKTRRIKSHHFQDD